MISNKLSCLLALVVMLSGCAIMNMRNFKDDFLNKEDYRPEDVRAGIRINSISFQDKREEISDRDIRIPGPFALPVKKDTVYPALTEVYKQFIKDEIFKYASGKGEKYDLTVIVKKGEKNFKLGWTGATEEVKFTLDIEFTGRSYQILGGGYATYKVNSIESTREYLEQLYRKAIKDCIYKSFEAFKDYNK